MLVGLGNVLYCPGGFRARIVCVCVHVCMCVCVCVCVCVCFGRVSYVVKEFIASFSSWNTNWFRQVESEWEEEISKDVFCVQR